MNYTTVSASGNSFKGLKTLIEMLAPNGTSLPVDPPYVERGSLFVLKGADPSQDKIYLSDGAGGWTLASGSPGVGGTIDSIIPGANITIDATDPANPIISATMINQTGKYLIGGGAQWSGTGYNYDVTANYYFNGSFNVGPVNLTLSAPDAINDRFDAFVADDAGNITTIEGTAAATPVTPAIPDNQLLIQYVFVQHGTTAPALTQENIYLENTEWTGANYTTSGTQVGTTNFDATDLPKQGTKCIDNLLDGRTGIRFNKGATIDVSSYSQLSLWVRLGNAATSKQKLNVQFENSSLAPTGNAIDLFQYGIQRGTLGTWQLAVVDISLFGVTSVQGFRMILTGGTNGTQYGWDVDLMILTNGSAPVIVSPTISFFKDGAKIADESAIDIIAGAGMTITAVDDPVNKRVKYTFSAASSGGGGGDVDSVTGLNTDNTDPANPVVKISVDGTTITGQGTPGDPLVSVGGTVPDATSSVKGIIQLTGDLGGTAASPTVPGLAAKLSSVSVDGTTITGNGTSGSPLVAKRDLPYMVASGTNSYTATNTPAVTAYPRSVIVAFQYANTGNSSFQADGLSALPIKMGGGELPPNSILAGSQKILILSNDNSHYQLQAGNVELPAVLSGEKVVTIKPEGLKAEYDIVNELGASGTTGAQLASRNWTAGNSVTYTGVQGEKRYFGSYVYFCTGTNLWWRVLMNQLDIPIKIGNVSDSGGIKTALEMQALFPDAIPPQYALGTGGIYRYEGTGVWMYFKNEIAV